MVTSFPLPEGFTEVEVFIIGTALLAEALLGFILNGLTIISFYKIRELRTPSNLLIISLAVADISLCLNAFVAAFSSFLRYWPYGSEGCQVHGIQGFVAVLSSISSCAAIAWDRYHQYCTRSKLYWNTSVSVVMFIWGFSAFWSVMPLFGWGEYDYEPLRTCCTLDYSKADRNFITFLFPLAFFEYLIPLFIMMTAYQCIHQKMKKSGQIELNTVLPVKCLIICWGPYSLLCFYAVIQDATLLSPKLRMIPAILAKISPAVNAYVYGLGNENYRGGIWQLLSGHKTDNKVN